MIYDPVAVKKHLRQKGIPEMLFDIAPILYDTEPYDAPTLESRVRDYMEYQGQDGIINPLRVAVTGQMLGPGIWDCLALLGRELCRRRIATTLVTQYEDLWEAYSSGNEMGIAQEFLILP